MGPHRPEPGRLQHSRSGERYEKHQKFECEPEAEHQMKTEGHVVSHISRTGTESEPFAGSEHQAQDPGEVY